MCGKSCSLPVPSKGVMKVSVWTWMIFVHLFHSTTFTCLFLDFQIHLINKKTRLIFNAKQINNIVLHGREFISEMVRFLFRVHHTIGFAGYFYILVFTKSALICVFQVPYIFLRTFWSLSHFLRSWWGFFLLSLQISPLFTPTLMGS